MVLKKASPVGRGIGTSREMAASSSPADLALGAAVEPWPLPDRVPCGDRALGLLRVGCVSLLGGRSLGVCAVCCVPLVGGKMGCGGASLADWGRRDCCSPGRAAAL